MKERKQSRVVGFNHVALEVGDIEKALAFYGEFLDFELRSKSDNMAFIDLGDQFLALSKGRRQAPDDERHFGLVVEDKAAVRRTLEDMGVEIVSDRFLDFLDPWGNRTRTRICSIGFVSNADATGAGVAAVTSVSKFLA